MQQSLNCFLIISCAEAQSPLYLNLHETLGKHIQYMLKIHNRFPTSVDLGCDSSFNMKLSAILPFKNNEFP